MCKDGLSLVLSWTTENANLRHSGFQTESITKGQSTLGVANKARFYAVRRCTTGGRRSCICFVEMDSTVREHIDRLKFRIDLLTREMTDATRTQEERKKLPSGSWNCFSYTRSLRSRSKARGQAVPRAASRRFRDLSAIALLHQ